MRQHTCKHCGGDIKVGEEYCSHCGIPLSPDLGKAPLKKFKLFFIALVIFCIGMIIWLPPDWTHFIK